MLPLIFATTLFVSAALLFSVQPMIAKMLLPLFGGAPAVWGTCMVFFQAMLLAGYAYAHYTSQWFGLRRQSALHVILLILAGLWLPIEVASKTALTPPTSADVVLWLLGDLLRIAGLPLFVLSATSALLQKWFSQTTHASANDPYFLYGASNLGSLLALAAYPTVMEPFLRLQTQTQFWTAGYAVLAALIVICALVARRSSAPSLTEEQVTEPAVKPSPIDWKTRLRWVLLAFVPSSLMLGVTSYLSNDIAAIPLLWVVPLAIYLLTFVIAFTRRRLIRQRWLEPAAAVTTLAVTLLLVSESTEPTWLILLLHLLLLFVGGLACHRRLAESRPPASALTLFYLCVSIGGVLGGVFNALIAPVIFKTVAEYPIALVLLCALYREASVPGTTRWQRALDVAVPGATIGLCGLMAWLVARFPQIPFPAHSAIVFGLPLILVYTCSERPPRFALALGAMFLGGLFQPGEQGRTVYVERSFFGVSRVTLDPSGKFRRLIHGNTLHGLQFIAPTRSHEPLAYYHRRGPLGQVFQAFDARPAATNVAVIGLGTGATACYARTNETWTFYEIDPVVVRIARDTNRFSFLAQSMAASTTIELGDARLRLREAPPGKFGLIVLDAFSSDAIPVHLLTREALALYLSKLAPGGLLVFHISNRCLDLEPVLRELALDAHLVSAEFDEDEVSAAAQAEGKVASQWAVLARNKADLGELNRNSRWVPLYRKDGTRVWSDDFSNLIGSFRWR